MSKKKRKIATQQGMEAVLGKRDKQMDHLVVDYVKARDVRMAATKEEVEAKTKLLAAMHEKKITVYEMDEFTAELVASDETVKVKTKKESEPEEQ